MKPKAFPFLRDAGICGVAALLSIGMGLTVRRHHAPSSVSSASSSSDRTVLSLAGFRAAVEGGKSLVLDARDGLLYARGHVPGALSLPDRSFDARYARLRSRLEANLDQPIILYCGNAHCDASTGVKARLQELGYTNVTVFSEGWTAWKNAGYPEERGDVATVILAPWKNPS